MTNEFRVCCPLCNRKLSVEGIGMRRRTVMTIINEIAKQYGVNPTSITRDTVRAHRITTARHHAFYEIAAQTNCTYREIAQYMHMTATAVSRGIDQHCLDHDVQHPRSTMPADELGRRKIRAIINKTDVQPKESEPLKAEPRVVSIFKTISDKHRLSISDIRAENRTRRFVRARHELYYELALQTSLSAHRIGSLCGQDHSTVLYAIAKHCLLNNLELPRSAQFCGVNIEKKLQRNAAVKKLIQVTMQRQNDEGGGKSLD